MSKERACPCDTFIHPIAVSNKPGFSAIAYRTGDYAAFRQALLLPLDPALSEKELINWRPGVTGDLAVQMAEWWAYLADILTFYNERIANEAYLRTACLPESVRRLIRVLGYRPRPGIGARGDLAALIQGQGPVTLPRGFQIRSKPGPGRQPRIFELDAATVIQAPDVVDVDLAPNPDLMGTGDSVLLKGAITSVKIGDRLLLAGDQSHAWLTVKQLQPEKDLRGKPNTRIWFAETPQVPNEAKAADYRLLKSARSSKIWKLSFGGGSASKKPIKSGSGQMVADLKGSTIAKLDTKIVADIVAPSAQATPLPPPADRFLADLVGVSRDIAVGERVLFETPGEDPDFYIVIVTGYREVVWYANNPGKLEDPGTTPAVPVLHTQIDLAEGVPDGCAQVLFGWQDVGELIGAPAETISGGSNTLLAASGDGVPSGAAFVEDAHGRGDVVKVSTVPESPATIVITSESKSPPELSAPLRLLFALLPVSQGQTVSLETLGSGSASLAGQEFVLGKSPLTYLLSEDSSSTGSYRSTLRVWVDGIEWKEVSSFYGQPPDARVFVTREDEDNKTHVLFGDGVNWARLPTGKDNVKATYRYGSGAEPVPAGTLTEIVQPIPNLRSVKNPVSVGGGADPDPPKQIRRYAPRSVLAFNRAVSADDYEAIAAQTPSVSRARAYWSFDAQQQRGVVKVYVGDDQRAKEDAQTALRVAGDPNRPVVVEAANPIPVDLSLSIRVDADYDGRMVEVGVRSALLDPDKGLFGANVIRIGQSIFDSQIYAACRSVPGVIAVSALSFSTKTPDTNIRHDPGEGGFYQLTSKSLTVTPGG
ncbi:MAG: baseplate J/gp47 family protein [Armatimonadota bacterium]|nr:baseplate J/gp47 family protein [Armatimonadota bacterium]